MSRILNYNEQKLKTGTAELLFASGFIKRTEKLTFYDKTRQFQRYTSLNERSTHNSLHISLNFDVKDDLPKEKLVSLSENYMSMLGFGNQPFLVYQHFDAAHPHIHIVTTNIRSDGSRISTHNLGRNQSEQARTALELKYGLIRAGAKKTTVEEQLRPVDARKIIYGKSALKQAVSNILRKVIDQYKFSTLPELNAILSLYHVRASRGNEGSSCFKHGGLVYRALDENGLPAGPPLKASSFYLKPTLAFLEKRFKENEPLKQPYARRYMVEIQFALAKASPRSLSAFLKELENAGINTILRKNKDGLIYGITYVDHKSKTVFNGSDLGKEYSAKDILKRCSSTGDQIAVPALKHVTNKRNEKSIVPSHAGQPIKWIDDLLATEQNDMTVPYPLKKDPKKKKKKQPGL